MKGYFKTSFIGESGHNQQKVFYIILKGWYKDDYDQHLTTH